MEAEFTQKARNKTTFRCNEGAKIADTINRTIQTGEPQTITVTSYGKDANNETVAKFRYTWSFKKRNQ